MRIALTFALCCAVAGQADFAMACTLARGFAIAKPPSVVSRPSADQPAALHITVGRFERAYSDDSPSCSAYGLIDFVLDAPPPYGSGFRFRRQSGELPFTLPELDIAPVGLTFRFRWLDLEPGQRRLRTIDSVIEISLDGRESEPTAIHVQHAGGLISTGNWRRRPAVAGSGRRKPDL
jgi:hypothetical protein